MLLMLVVFLGLLSRLLVFLVVMLFMGALRL